MSTFAEQKQATDDQVWQSPPLANLAGGELVPANGRNGESGADDEEDHDRRVRIELGMAGMALGFGLSSLYSLGTMFTTKDPYLSTQAGNRAFGHFMASGLSVAPVLVRRLSDRWAATHPQPEQPVVDQAELR